MTYADGDSPLPFSGLRTAAGQDATQMDDFELARRKRKHHREFESEESEILAEESEEAEEEEAEEEESEEDEPIANLAKRARQAAIGRLQRKAFRRVSSVSKEDLEMCRTTLANMPPEKPVLTIWDQRDVSLPWPSLTVQRLETTAKPLPKPPKLEKTQWLEDEHISYMIDHMMRPPSWCWVASPTQVALMRSGQDRRDICAMRDGNLRCLWDIEKVRCLLLPFNADRRAGKQSGAGTHWSMLAVRRREDSNGHTIVEAKLHDSLMSPPASASKIAQELLGHLGASKYWSMAPRRSQLCAMGLQRDNHQCGIYCILAIHQQIQAELGQESYGQELIGGKITVSMAARLRDAMCKEEYDVDKA